MGALPSADPQLVWEVHADQIDLDRWASAVVEFRLRRLRERSSFVTRNAFWLIALLWLALGVSTSEPWFVVPAVLTVAAAVGAMIWNRSLPRRLAARMRAVPAASEPFTFTAAASGTTSTAPSGSDELSWSRYRSAVLLDDLIALELIDGNLRLLPLVSLVPSIAPPEAVAMMATWIDQATAQPSGGAGA